MRLAGGDSGVAVWRLPACGRAQCESRPVAPRACLSVSRSRWHCATGRCYSDPHTVESGVLHLPVTAAPRSNAFAFQRLVPAFQLSIRLRVAVRDDAWLRFRVFFLGVFENYLDIRFLHRLAQIPMHEEATEAVQNAA